MWLLLILTIICFVSVRVENENDAARRASDGDGTQLSCASLLDKDPGLMLEQWSGDTAASRLRRGHNGLCSAAPLEEALAC